MDEFVSGTTVTVHGETYKGADLVKYLEEHREEFTEQTVLKEIEEAQKDEEILKMWYMRLGGSPNFIMVKEESDFILGEKKILYQGNALFMALLCKRYDLAIKLAKNHILKVDGRSSVIYRMNSLVPVVCDIENENLLAIVLEDETVPEELWRELWQAYSMNTVGGALYVPKARCGSVLIWLTTLKKIKEQRPEFFREMVTERLLVEILWCYAAAHKRIAKKEEKKLLTKWKQVLPAPEDGKLWAEVIWSLELLCSLCSDECMKRIRCFTRLWKQLSKQPVVLDLLEDAAIVQDIRRRFEGCTNGLTENVIEEMFEVADVIVNGEEMYRNGVFRYAMKDSKRLKQSINKGLITKRMIPEAVLYARENAPEHIPLLILKKHEENEP